MAEKVSFDDGNTFDMESGNSQQDSALTAILKNSSHPYVCVFHFAFKIACLLVYIFGDWFGYIGCFILVVLLLAFDFWTVKNISGRLLVGLRWWNDIAEDGTSTWVFESAGDEDQINPTDRNVFWVGIYVWPAVWLVFFIKNLLSFQFDRLVLITMAMTFAWSNVIGYWKCSRDQKKKATDMASSFVTGNAGSILSSLASRF